MNTYLGEVEIILGNGATNLGELDNLCKKLFGSKFAGISTSDKLIDLDFNKPYCIYNLDTSKESGSHWIAVVLYEHKKIIIYDSFGRYSEDIIPNLTNNYDSIDTDHDAEQKTKEYNCGQRCVAFLLLYDRYGFNYAILI